MKVLYVVLNDLSRKDSGSGIRPNKMLQAFKDRGHELYILSGSQDFNHAKERKAKVQAAMEWLKENTPDLCYIESSTYPILNHCDYQLIRYLAKRKIPTSYFYRDLYRIFPELFQTRKGWKNEVKEFFLRGLQKHTDRVLSKIDVVYFPGQGYADHFDYARRELLPPASEVNFPEKHPDNNTCIYVGGVTDLYGFPLIMDTFRILNKDGMKYRLILVCREKEFKNYSDGKNLPEWLEVHHVSGDALVPLYHRADLGLLALRYNDYAHLQIGIKLFQYVGHGLPVLSTNVRTMAQIIAENDFGEVAEDNPEDYAAAIVRMLSDKEKLNYYRTTMKENMLTKHQWVHRVDKIVEDLTGVKPE